MDRYQCEVNALVYPQCDINALTHIDLRQYIDVTLMLVSMCRDEFFIISF